MFLNSHDNNNVYMSIQLEIVCGQPQYMEEKDKQQILIYGGVPRTYLETGKRRWGPHNLKNTYSTCSYASYTVVNLSKT